MDTTRKMTEGRPLKQIFFFSLPLMVGNVFQQLYTVADTAIVGRGVSLRALAALGAVDWLCWMFLSIMQGFTAGFGVRMSQKYGQGDTEELRRTVGLSARFSVYIAFFALLLGEGGASLFLRWLHVSPELRPLAELYLRIYVAGIPAMIFYNLCAASLRAVGDSKTPLRAMTAAALTNVALDLLAVYVLGWGIAGAAGATVFSQCLSGLICALRMKKMPELRFTRRELRRDGKVMRELARLGAPMALANAIIAVGGMAVQTVVNGFSLGFIAGFTATNKLYGILEIAALSYGYGITTYVGQNYGAGLFPRIRRGMREALWLSLLTSLLIGTVIFLLARPITGIFLSTEDAAMLAEASDAASTYLRIMSVFLPVLYVLYAYRAGLQGMGNSMIPMLSGFVELFFRVGVAVIIYYNGREYGIFASEPSAWVCGALLLAVSYYVMISRIEKKRTV